MTFDRESWMQENNVREIEVRDSEWAVGWVAHGHDDQHAHMSLSHYEARSYRGDVQEFVFGNLAAALRERRQENRE